MAPKVDVPYKVGAAKAVWVFSGGLITLLDSCLVEETTVSQSLQRITWKENLIVSL